MLYKCASVVHDNGKCSAGGASHPDGSLKVFAQIISGVINEGGKGSNVKGSTN